MSGEQIIGAVLSALIASLLFHWQVKHWSRWIPANVGKKGKKQLLKENRSTLQIARAISIGGFLGGVIFYATGLMGDHDWRGLGIGLGLMVFLPVSYILAANVTRGSEKIKEAIVAYIIVQKTPPVVLFILSGLCFVGGVVSAVSLLLHPL